MNVHVAKVKVKHTDTFYLTWLDLFEWLERLCACSNQIHVDATEKVWISWAESLLNE